MEVYSNVSSAFARNVVMDFFFAAPKSQHWLKQHYRMFFALALFGCTAFLLYKTGNTTPAVIFATIAIVNQVTAYILKQ